LKLATDTTVWVHVYFVTDVMPFCKTIEVVKKENRLMENSKRMALIKKHLEVEFFN